MIKLILYIILLSVGGYYASGYIPDSAKEKIISAAGLKGKSFEILNPAAKRAEILQKLEDNVFKLEQFQSDSEFSGENADQQKNEADVVIAESKALLEEMKELNPKTGVLQGVVGKIFGIGSGSQQSTTTSQVTPELKEQICK